MLDLVWMVLAVLLMAAPARPHGNDIGLIPLAVDDWDKGHELPDVVAGRIFGDRIFLRVENRGAEWLRNVSLRVLSELLQPTVGESINLQPGQRSSLHAVLRQPDGAGQIPMDACPLSVRLGVMVGSVVVVEKTTPAAMPEDR